MQCGDRILLDAHYANRLQSYLEAFEHVSIASTQFYDTQHNMVDLATLAGHERTTISLLPLPYREDRYFLHRGEVRRLLDREMARADLILVAPHSAFEWATLAGKMAVERRLKFGLEADWVLHSVWGDNIRAMSPGLQRLRHSAWLKAHTKTYKKIMRHAAVALLEGPNVFDAYSRATPNPQQVLNVQITDNDRASPDSLERKQKSVREGAPLKIVYAGRLISMKGPEDWIAVLSRLKGVGVTFEATWLGDGSLKSSVMQLAQEAGLGGMVSFPGQSPRHKVRELVEVSDVFMFCHKTQESPRCLLEALALGTPIVGYTSPHAHHLISPAGGGRLVPGNDIEGLATEVQALDGNREALAEMMAQAHRSAQTFDRDSAVSRRIRLMQEYLPQRRSSAN